MTQKPDPAARFLLLASRPGYESLRRECNTEGLCKDGILQADDLPWGRLGDIHHACQGRGWLPLPMAERMGALCEIACGKEIITIQHRWNQRYLVMLWSSARGAAIDGLGDTMWDALTEALLAAKAQEAT